MPRIAKVGLVKPRRSLPEGQGDTAGHHMWTKDPSSSSHLQQDADAVGKGDAGEWVPCTTYTLLNRSHFLWEMLLCKLEKSTHSASNASTSAGADIMVWLDSTAVTRQLYENHQERGFGSALILGARITCFDWACLDGVFPQKRCLPSKQM